MFLALTWAFSGPHFAALTLCTSQLVLNLSVYLYLPFTPHQYTTVVPKCALLPFLGGFTKKQKDENVLSTPRCSSEIAPPTALLSAVSCAYTGPLLVVVTGGEGGFSHRKSKSPSFSQPVTL